MKLLIKCYPPEDCEEMDVAVVDMHELLAKDFLRKKEILDEAVAKDVSVREVVFLDMSARYYPDLWKITSSPVPRPSAWEDLLTKEEREEFDAEEMIVLSEDRYAELFVDENGETQDTRTEGDIVTFTDRGFFWSATKKHTDWDVETKLVPYSVLTGRLS